MNPNIVSNPPPPPDLIHDPHMVAITIAGLSAAVALGAIAALLTTTRGNRISDYDQKNGAALNVQILNQLKVATSVPIVALYFIAVVAGLGTPGLAFYITNQAYQNELAQWTIAQTFNSGSTITLASQFDREPRTICVESSDVNVNTQARVVRLPLRYVTTLQSFIFVVDNDSDDPIAVNAQLTPDWKHVKLDLAGTHEAKLDVVGGVATTLLRLPVSRTLPLTQAQPN